MHNNLLTDLNDRQLEAVTTTDKPLRIIAGAGSGKTRVITTKIAYLIQEENILPWKILAVTFTNKAAKEMKERVQKITGELSSKPFISTFHAWCSRILREEFALAGLEKGFLIVDTSDQKAIIRKILKDFNIPEETNKKDISKKVLGRISYWKSNFITPEEALSDSYSVEDKTNARVYEAYENQLKQNNSVDFDDLQLRVHQIFNKNPDVVNKWRDRYDYVMVDEFQDTNDVQFDLIKFLTKNKTNLTVVGDPDQTIYSWRGAKVNIILNFEQTYKNAKSVILDENYRSTQQILNIANDFIENNKNREKKTIFTKNTTGSKVQLKECATMYTEGKFIANEIKELVKSGQYQYGDIFVLYRMNAWSNEIEKVLDNSKIPFQLIGGIKFRDRKVIKDATALLKFVAVKDNLSGERVLAFTPKIGAMTIQKLNDMANDMELSLFDLLTHENDSFLMSLTKNLFDLRNTLIEARKMREQNYAISEVMRYLLVSSKYEERLKVLEDEDAIQNIKALYDQLNRFDEAFDPEDYAEEDRYIAFLQEESLSSEEDDNAQPNKVTLLTIHGAKGLENKVVFVSGLSKNIFPGVRSTFSKEDMEEERRALYVALTRAKEKLYLSYVVGEWSYLAGENLSRSIFVKELNDDYYEFDSGLFVHANGEITSNNSIAASQPPKTWANQPEDDVIETDLKKGDIVNHVIFGEGIIIKVLDKQLYIAFNNPMFGTTMVKIDNPAISKK